MSKDTTIEVDKEVTDAVAETVKSSLREELLKDFKVPTAQEIADAMKASQETATKKNIHEDAEPKQEARNLKKGIDTLPKEIRFTKAVKGLKEGDRRIVREYNESALKGWAEKADYQNVTTAADGASIVPDPEFIAEVERLTDDYGVASREATVRQTDRDSVTLLSGTNEISFTKVGEATATNAQKLTYANSTAVLDKYVAKLIMTNEWIEDAAINVFTDATTEVARARAKLFDQLVFTDATDGLLSAAVSDSYKTQTVGAALSDFDFDDAMDAVYKVVGSVRRRGKFYMHPTVWNELRQTKAGDGSNSSANYYAGGPLEGVTPTIDGYEVVLVDVMPDSGDITANEAFAVFGDLSRVLIHVKRQLKLDMFDSGTLTDAGGSNFNLIDQDAQALRATTRVKPQTRFEGAFTIIGTGTVS